MAKRLLKLLSAIFLKLIIHQCLPALLDPPPHTHTHTHTHTCTRMRTQHTHTHLLKGWGVGGVGPSKIESLGGVRNFMLDRGDKPERGERLMRGFSLFLLPYSSITFTLCVGKLKFPLFIASRFSSKSL